MQKPSPINVPVLPLESTIEYLAQFQSDPNFYNLCINALCEDEQKYQHDIIKFDNEFYYPLFVKGSSRSLAILAGLMREHLDPSLLNVFNNEFTFFYFQC